MRVASALLPSTGTPAGSQSRAAITLSTPAPVEEIAQRAGEGAFVGVEAAAGKSHLTGMGPQTAGAAGDEQAGLAVRALEQKEMAVLVDVPPAKPEVPVDHPDWPGRYGLLKSRSSRSCPTLLFADPSEPNVVTIRSKQSKGSNDD